MQNLLVPDSMNSIADQSERSVYDRWYRDLLREVCGAWLEDTVEFANG